MDTPPLAEENRWKPAETRAVGGTIGPLSAERVASVIVDGIDRRRFAICPGTGTRVPARFGSVLPPLLNRGFDRRVAWSAGRRSGHDARSPEHIPREGATWVCHLCRGLTEL
ncbi:hypothetical protein [Streptomyces sp. NBC_01451]|uniref:hypothetical protein n=1 Tax=Streptomyces sp. NBC_01451 TaxID=2903872 RepID=UPI002E308DD9|nr:hypothetical protein [Streptomyces sp. NBC_01451]